MNGSEFLEDDVDYSTDREEETLDFRSEISDDDDGGGGGLSPGEGKIVTTIS